MTRFLCILLPLSPFQLPPAASVKTINMKKARSFYSCTRDCSGFLLNRIQFMPSRYRYFATKGERDLVLETERYLIGCYQVNFILFNLEKAP